jgi:hypothetical protein
MIERASCQSCGAITVWTGDTRCSYCDGFICQIDMERVIRKPGRSDGKRSRWTDLRREQVVEAYAQGHNIPEIAAVVWRAMGYANPATARAAIRNEFARINVAIRPPRRCSVDGCRRDPLTGSPFCFSHDPERSEQRLEIGELMRAAQENWPRVGAAHPIAKISEADALAIRRSTEPSHALAERYGLSPGHIARIREGKAWAHLETEAA